MRDPNEEAERERRHTSGGTSSSKYPTGAAFALGTVGFGAADGLATGTVIFGGIGVAER